MKIKTALILCAGYGKRLKPITNDIPKPLLKVKKWLNRFLEWNIFEAIMVKNSLWKKNNTPIYFGQD